jgi:hypothetical protein
VVTCDASDVAVVATVVVALVRQFPFQFSYECGNLFIFDSDELTGATRCSTATVRAPKKAVSAFLNLTVPAGTSGGPV